MSEIRKDASGLDARQLQSRNNLVIGLLLISAFVVILNETIIGVAMPHLMKDLGVTAGQAQWLTTAFMLTMAVVIPITGFLLQRLNTRPVFILAMSLFSLGTLIGAIAPGLTVLILGRIVQACGTAIMMPLLMTTVMTLVPPETRGRTMGNITIVISVAPAIGPTISGFILSMFDWRWMFWLVLPIALAALALGASKIRNVGSPRRAPLDLISVPLAAAGFGILVYGLSTIGEGAVAGEESAYPAWLPIIIGAAFVTLFVLRQLALQKQDRALLDLRTFLSPVFTVATIMMAISMMAMFGVIILLPIYTQNVLHFDALTTGLLLLPGGLLMGLMARFVGAASDRHGPTGLVIAGSILLTLSALALASLGTTTPWYFVLASHLLFMGGLGLLFTPLFSASLGSLPPHLYSHGSAVIGTVQQVGGAAGTALFVSIMTLSSSKIAAAGAEPVTALSGGISTAMLYCTAISVIAIIAAFFVRRPNGPTMHEAIGH
ncbi:MAG: hypothetical protein RLZZ444_2733 [Pseudomonadota bacterium]|jgi:DHA2 family lincomycin resistance protein-like MFS transporter